MKAERQCFDWICNLLLCNIAFVGLFQMLSGDDRMKSEMFGSNSLVVLVTDDDPCALEVCFR